MRFLWEAFPDLEADMVVGFCGFVGLWRLTRERAWKVGLRAL